MSDDTKYNQSKTNLERLPEYFSHSSLETFACPRKYYYSYIERKSSKHPSRAMVFGDAWHTGLSVWYKSEPHDIAYLKHCLKALMHLSEADPTIVERASKAVDTLDKIRLREELAIFIALNTLPPLADYEAGDHRTGELLESMLRAYFKVYSYEPWKVIHVERDFAFSLPDNSLIVGVVDLAIEWRDGIMPNEHKTTSAIYNYGDSLNPHQQLDIEILGLKSIYGADKVRNYACVNVANVPRRKAGITAADFQRFPDVYRSDAQLEESVINMVMKIDDIKNCAKREYWPMEKSICHQYGGCPYRRVCRESPENRADILTKYFTDKPQVDYTKIRRAKDGFLDADKSSDSNGSAQNTASGDGTRPVDDNGLGSNSDN